MIDSQRIPYAILSFPRSGNHLCRFILEYLSSRPTLGCSDNPSDTPIYKNIFDSQVSPLFEVNGSSTPIGLKVHRISEIKRDTAMLDENFSLIFVLRDPLEAIINHTEGNSLQFENHINWMLKNINYYNEFKGRKILISYDCLMTSPIDCINQLARFIEINMNSTALSKLISNHEVLFSMNIKAKGRSWKSPASGTDLNYHKKKIPLPILEQLTQLWELKATNISMPD